MKECEELSKDKEERKSDDGDDELEGESEYYEGFKREELVQMECLKTMDENLKKCKWRNIFLKMWLLK